MGPATVTWTDFELYSRFHWLSWRSCAKILPPPPFSALSVLFPSQILSLQADEMQKESQVEEYERELARARWRLKKLREEVRQAKRKVEEAGERDVPLQDSIRQSYEEILQVPTPLLLPRPSSTWGGAWLSQCCWVLLSQRATCGPRAAVGDSETPILLPLCFCSFSV